jgi:glucose 1-dehydrogenase
LLLESAPLAITVSNMAPEEIEIPLHAKMLDDAVKLNPLLGIIPLRRLDRPENVASLAEFLAGLESYEVSGTTIFVDAG